MEKIQPKLNLNQEFPQFWGTYMRIEYFFPISVNESFRNPLRTHRLNARFFDLNSDFIQSSFN